MSEHSHDDHKHGVLGVDYAEGRKTNTALKYRLRRRTGEVRSAVDEFLGRAPRSIIDLGTAEGRMLAALSAAYPSTETLGIEYNPELVSMAREMNPGINVRQGDVQDLSDIADGSYEVAVATAVIEHLEEPAKFLAEVRRILAPGGLFVVTCPDPFWEHIATMVGHLADEQHHEVPNLKKLRRWVSDSGLDVVKAQKFMLSPIGMPLELPVERFLRGLHLGALMANQLVVARRT